ncbi:methyltransferase domain-containing protein [Streptomyces sp. NPDC047130]|uniref:methyltransferase domain-containing protein n=1 Tax=Streptomyces sp. NPDC047130 TaxID=3155261 RepID=UPI0033D799DC
MFAPVHSPSTATALDLLGLTDPDPGAAPTSLLEIGSGSGVISVQAALANCTTLATDINRDAVENTRRNAERHGVTDRLTVLHSHLFDAVDDDARFDRVFWSSNYVLAPAQFSYASMHERAYLDAGYRTHRRYVEQAVHQLTDGGSALLHFCERGDAAALAEIARECGRELRVLRRRTVLEGTDPIEHFLLEVVPVGSRRAWPVAGKAVRDVRGSPASRRPTGR